MALDPVAASGNFKAKQLSFGVPFNRRHRIDLGPCASKLTFMMEEAGTILYVNRSAKPEAFHPKLEKYSVLLNSNNSFEVFRSLHKNKTISMTFDPVSKFFVFSLALKSTLHKEIIRSFIISRGQINIPQFQLSRDLRKLSKDSYIRCALHIDNEGNITNLRAAPLPFDGQSSLNDVVDIPNLIEFAWAMKAIGCPESLKIKDYNTDSLYLGYLNKYGIKTIEDIISVFSRGQELSA